MHKDRRPGQDRCVCILSIDGGGLRGLIPATVLHRLETLIAERYRARGEAPRPLAEHFHLIAGASTGAILAAGLAGCGPAGQPLATCSELMAVYTDAGARVFRQSRRAPPAGLLGPKYLQALLSKAYDRVCGDARLSDCLTDVLAPAYDLGKPGVFRFRGGPSTKMAQGLDFRLSDMLLAATAAPYLFEPARIAPIGRGELFTLVDGSLFAANPALDALLEARHLFGEGGRCLVLSLGTRSSLRPLSYYDAKAFGLTSWLDPLHGAPLIQMFMQGQVDQAHLTFGRLLPNPADYIRIDASAVADLPDLDDGSADGMRRLSDMASNLVQDEQPRLQHLADRLAGTTNQ